MKLFSHRTYGLATALAAAAALCSPAGAGSIAIAYDNTPFPLPGNVLMVPYEPTGTSEFGDRVGLAPGTPRWALAATVTFSSWGCQAGHFYSGDCVTGPGATFWAPITLNLYNVGLGGSVGSLIGTATQTFAIPYRPSADAVHCGGGKWYERSSATCFNGKAVTVVFNLKHLHIVLPDEVIFGIAFNTTHYGYRPVGESAACFSSSGGCGYDWLGIGLADPATTLSAGSNPAPSDAYQATLTDSCSNGAVAPFGLDAGCWTGLKPAVRFDVKKGRPGGSGDDED
jgi:hypothetical protein